MASASYNPPLVRLSMLPRWSSIIGGLPWNKWAVNREHTYGRNTPSRSPPFPVRSLAATSPLLCRAVLERLAVAACSFVAVQLGLYSTV